jgi:hypothetical protein
MNDGAGSPPPQQSGVGPILAGGILVSAASGIGYMTVYAYELGASKYFGTPPEFISVSVVNLAMAALVVLLLVLLFQFIATFLPSTFLSNMKSQALAFLFLATVSTLAILSVVQGQLARIGLIALSIAAAALWVVLIVLGRLEASGKLKPRNGTELPPVEHLAQFMPLQTAVSVVGSLLFLIFVATAAYASGFSWATIRASFCVTHERHPKVISAIYGDTAIAPDFSAKQQTVTKTFTIYKVGQTLPSFTVLDVGPLKSRPWR